MRKRIGIRKQKKEHAANLAQYGSVRDNEAHKLDYDDGRYWNMLNISGPRKFSKQCTNRKLRRIYRDAEKNEDTQALQNGDYVKVFDYDWTVY